MGAMSVHSQYTSTVRVKVPDPATLLAVIWYSPLSSRVTLAIVKLVAVTVNLVSVTGALFLVSVMLLLVYKRWVGIEGVRDCELVPFCWCCSGSGWRELRGICRARDMHLGQSGQSVSLCRCIHTYIYIQLYSPEGYQHFTKLLPLYRVP